MVIKVLDIISFARKLYLMTVSDPANYIFLCNNNLMLDLQTVITQTCALHVRAHVRVYFLGKFYNVFFFLFFVIDRVDRARVPRKGRVVEPYPPGCGQLFFYTIFCLIFLSLYILIMIHMLEHNVAFIKELVEYQQLHFRLLIKRKKIRRFFYKQRKKCPQ